MVVGGSGRRLLGQLSTRSQLMALTTQIAMNNQKKMLEVTLHEESGAVNGHVTFQGTSLDRHSSIDFKLTPEMSCCQDQ